MFVHKNFTRNQRGQSLIEVLVAITVGIFVVVALINAAVAAMRNAQYAKNQNIATKLAQEGMEQVRAVRDRMDWTIFSTYGDAGKPCYSVDTSSWQLVGNDAGCAGLAVTGFASFLRMIKVEDGVSGQEKITVKVSWTDAAGIHTSELTSYLTQWSQ